MNKVTVTTSWDDGHVLDVRLATLLKKYNIRGTFYISPKDREFTSEERLTNDQVRELAKDFEIGAHTMTHPRLTDLGKKEAKEEIVSSKEYLEKLLGNLSLVSVILRGTMHQSIWKWCAVRALPWGAPWSDLQYVYPKTLFLYLPPYMHTDIGLTHGPFLKE